METQKIVDDAMQMNSENTLAQIHQMIAACNQATVRASDEADVLALQRARKYLRDLSDERFDAVLKPDYQLLSNKFGGVAFEWSLDEPEVKNLLQLELQETGRMPDWAQESERQFFKNFGG